MSEKRTLSFAKDLILNNKLVILDNCGNNMLKLMNTRINKYKEVLFVRKIICVIVLGIFVLSTIACLSSCGNGCKDCGGDGEVVCSLCDGDGQRTCLYCHGTGSIHGMDYFTMMPKITSCYHCSGGVVSCEKTEPCKSCSVEEIAE